MNAPLLLVGSHAANVYHEVGRPFGQDFDIVGPYDDVVKFLKSVGPLKSLLPISEGKKLVARYSSGLIFEAEIAWPGSAGEDLYLTGLADANRSFPSKPSLMIPTYEFLYTLKMSHRFLKNSPHFLKTMGDIRSMRTHIGGNSIPSRLLAFYDRRQKATYTYGHPKLNVNKQEFFNADGVDYKFDHDSIHLSVMRNDRPAYESFKDDQAEVFCSKEKFFDCDYRIRINAVLEESMVLAIERSQVPFPGLKTPKESFIMALQKVCTSITSGWFRDYAWENYHNVITCYDNNYVDKFWKDVESGLVVPYQGK